MHRKFHIQLYFGYNIFDIIRISKILSNPRVRTIVSIILTKYFWLKNLVCRARTTESSDSSPSRWIRSWSSASLFFLASSAATLSLLLNRSPRKYKCWICKSFCTNQAFVLHYWPIDVKVLYYLDYWLEFLVALHFY